jgi:hypothetical protein
MYWLLAVVGISGYVLYTRSLPIPKPPLPTPDGVNTPSVAWQFPRGSTANSNYVVRPGRYQVGAGDLSTVGRRGAPPTQNGAPGTDPFAPFSAQ